MDTIARQALVRRWLDLTRVELPAMAGLHGWPIRLDHCFMRVCLDAACGRPWRDVARAPAIRHLPLATLTEAVAIAERIRADPALLPDLNARSLRLRRDRATAGPC